ncbi:MAG: DUF3768 domain-containing protein [Hyphomicrobiaceae bacterium]
MNIDFKTSGDPEHVAAQRAANDAFRATLTGGCLTLTPGIIALGRANQDRIVRAVRNCSAFDDDDPLDTHDIGDIAVELEEPGIDRWCELIFFKIVAVTADAPIADTPTPAPANTTRQLIIMLASEW